MGKIFSEAIDVLSINYENVKDYIHLGSDREALDGLQVLRNDVANHMQQMDKVIDVYGPILKSMQPLIEEIRQDFRIENPWKLLTPDNQPKQDKKVLAGNFKAGSEWYKFKLYGWVSRKFYDDGTTGFAVTGAMGEYITVTHFIDIDLLDPKEVSENAH